MPLNADFEGGFATEPEGVAVSVTLAVATGIAGLSIEDSTSDRSNPLLDYSLAVERIAAARRAIDESETAVFLTARTEGFIVGRPDLAKTIRRLVAFAKAGADCLYAPGIRPWHWSREFGRCGSDRLQHSRPRRDAFPAKGSKRLAAGERDQNPTLSSDIRTQGIGGIDADQVLRRAR